MSLLRLGIILRREGVNDTGGHSTTKIEIDSDLIGSAEAYLEKLPKKPSEIIEHWTYLGMAAAKQLTEYEQLMLMLMSGSGKLSIKETET